MTDDEDDLYEGDDAVQVRASQESHPMNENPTPAAPRFEVCSQCGGTDQECQQRRCWGWLNGQRMFYDGSPAALSAALAVSRLGPIAPTPAAPNAAEAVDQAIRATGGDFCAAIANALTERDEAVSFALTYKTLAEGYEKQISELRADLAGCRGEVERLTLELAATRKRMEVAEGRRDHQIPGRPLSCPICGGVSHCQGDEQAEGGDNRECYCTNPACGIAGIRIHWKWWHTLTPDRALTSRAGGVVRLCSWARHHDGCDVYHPNQNPPALCSCGFDKAKASLGDGKIRLPAQHLARGEDGDGALLSMMYTDEVLAALSAAGVQVAP